MCLFFPTYKPAEKKHCMDGLHISLEAGSYKAACVRDIKT